MIFLQGSKMQKVMFISLLLDLLGFTVILPLFPALLEYYSRNDSSGLYSTLLSWIVAFQEAIGIPSKFHSVLFGGINLILSFSLFFFLILTFFIVVMIGGDRKFQGRFGAFLSFLCEFKDKNSCLHLVRKTKD